MRAGASPLPAAQLGAPWLELRIDRLEVVDAEGRRSRARGVADAIARGSAPGGVTLAAERGLPANALSHVVSEALDGGAVRVRLIARQGQGFGYLLLWPPEEEMDVEDLALGLNVRPEGVGVVGSGGWLAPGCETVQSSAATTIAAGADEPSRLRRCLAAIAELFPVQAETAHVYVAPEVEVDRLYALLAATASTTGEAAEAGALRRIRFSATEREPPPVGERAEPSALDQVPAVDVDLTGAAGGSVDDVLAPGHTTAPAEPSDPARAPEPSEPVPEEEAESAATEAADESAQGAVDLGSAVSGSPGSPQDEGAFDPNAVVRQIRARLRAIQSCYEDELARDPSLQGRIVVRFTIEPSGTVSAVTATRNEMGSPAVAGCLVRVIRRLRFDPGPQGGSVSFAYPFVFHPHD